MPYGLSLPNLVLASVALAWLLYRLNKVLSTPLDDLIKVLGLEVPVAPTPALLDITSTGVSVHWKSSEERNAVARYDIRINGQLIGQVSPQDVSISVTGLLPSRYYNLRIVAVNSGGFQACSEAIRLRTLDDADDISHSINGVADRSHQAKALEYGPAPAITPYRAFTEQSTSANSASGSNKENVQQPKRGSAARRVSPATSHAEQQAYSSDDGQIPTENPETVKALTAKLDALRRESEDLDRQEKEEEHEYHSTKEALSTKRESLRQQLKERDDESKDLKKNVTSLERANTAAQSKKTAQEKALQQKLSERERLRTDVERWEKDMERMQQDGKQLEHQKENLESTNHEKIIALRAEQEEDQQILKGIEDKIHEQGTTVKDLEDERRSLQGTLPEYGHVDAPSDDAQKQFEWQQRIQMLEAQYNSLYAACRDASEHYQKAAQHLQFVSARVGAQPGMHLPPSQEGLGAGVEAYNAFNAPESTSTHSSFSVRPVLPPISGPRTGSPFYSLAGGLSLPPFPQPKDERDVDALTGGALTSPGADALLPSGLLGDEPDELSKARSTNIFQRLGNGHGSRPSSTIPQSGASAYDRRSNGSEFLPGLGALPGLGSSDGIAGAAPTSPGSIHSLSPSAVNSPYGSRANLHQHQSSDGYIDSDRRSIKSTSSSTRAIQGPRRFHEFFFNRQRGKTTSDESPELGTLRGGQSQSLPREFDDASDAQNKKTATSGSLFGQMSSAVLGRRLAKTTEDGESESAPPPIRPNPFSMFSSKVSPWSRSTELPRPASPRPTSTYSTETPLPHPSTDARPFGWSTSDNMGTRSSFAAYPWSNYSSRRASLAQGSSKDLLSDIAQSDEEGQDLEANQSPPQAPIGTKPSKAKSALSAAQLDPTARTFKSMFSKEKKTDKSEKSTPRSKKKDKRTASEDLVNLFADDDSPPDSRKSKDAEHKQGITPTEELTDAEDRVESGPTTPSEGVPANSSTNRESFMKKLTRTSSSRFNLPGLKDKGSLFSRRSYQSEDNDEDSGESAQLGRSVESVTSSPQPNNDKRSSAFSLASLTRRSKKGPNAPSISENSMASETGDESEERESTSLSVTE